jgi:hypothetical protein
MLYSFQGNPQAGTEMAQQKQAGTELDQQERDGTRPEVS